IPPCGRRGVDSLSVSERSPAMDRGDAHAGLAGRTGMAVTLFIRFIHSRWLCHPYENHGGVVMTRIGLLSLALLIALSLPAEGEAPLHAAFAETDITPELHKDRPVYMAGFGHNRKATAVHDPLKARAVVLRHGDRTIALVCLDVVGLFHASAQRV